MNFQFQYAEDDQTVNYLDGLATHWYATDVHLTVEDFAKNNMKELFLLATDASKLTENLIRTNILKTFYVI